MGIPYHYAIDIPKRCHRLLQDYWATVEGQPYKEFNGPLATTFLLALAAPIVNFPVERIAKKGKPAKVEHALTAKQAETIDNDLHLPHFKGTDFFAPGAWRYLFVPIGKDIRIAELPEDVLHGFSDPKTEIDAAELDTWTWVRALRNALAHSAIAYVNADGGQTVDSAVSSVVFVSEDKPNNPTGHHLLLISRDDFREFVAKWMKWLTT